MSSVIPPPLAADNTVLGRFAVIGRFDLLQGLLGTVDILDEVRVEAQRLGVVWKAVDAGIQNGWVRVNVIKDIPTLQLYARFAKRLGKGEAASIAYLSGQGGGCLLTDDYLAYQIASVSLQAHGVRSSLWLLHQGVQHGLATPSDVDHYIGVWSAAGQRVPPHGNTYAKLDAVFSAGLPVSIGGLF